MSLKYGLNVKGAGRPPVPARRPIFDDDEDDEPAEEEPSTLNNHGPSKSRAPLSGPPKRKREADSDHQADISSMGASRARVRAAEELDAGIFDYDSFHDAKSTVQESKKAAARQEAVERKPKYINNLLDAAARRKQDQMVAREKLLQKEREAEGDEFADKEKFVTGAYKEQQEETRRLEEEEKKQKEADEKRKRTMGGGGMQGFYRSMMDEREREHNEALEAAGAVGKEGDIGEKAATNAESEAETAADLKAKGVHLNEEGQIIDKRELLSAGLNVGKAGEKRGAEHLRSTNRPVDTPAYQRSTGNRDAQRERQSRMMEEQLAEKAKRAREEEEAERAKIEQAAKTQKTDMDKMDAKARYLARKAAKERGEG